MTGRIGPEENLRIRTANDWMPDPVSLSLIAALAEQIPQGAPGFAVFGNDPKVHCTAERDHVSRDGAARGVAALSESMALF